MLAHFVEGADVRVVQGTGSTGFPLESAEGVRVLGEVLGQKFQCDNALPGVKLLHSGKSYGLLNSESSQSSLGQPSHPHARQPALWRQSPERETR